MSEIVASEMAESCAVLAALETGPAVRARFAELEESMAKLIDGQQRRNRRRRGRTHDRMQNTRKNTKIDVGRTFATRWFAPEIVIPARRAHCLPHTGAVS